mgnify:FL=1
MQLKNEPKACVDGVLLDEAETANLLRATLQILPRAPEDPLRDRVPTPEEARELGLKAIGSLRVTCDELQDLLEMPEVLPAFTWYAKTLRLHADRLKRMVAQIANEAGLVDERDAARLLAMYAVKLRAERRARGEE